MHLRPILRQCSFRRNIARFKFSTKFLRRISDRYALRISDRQWWSQIGRNFAHISILSSIKASRLYCGSASHASAASSGPQPEHSAEEFTALRARVDEQERQLIELRAHVMQLSGQLGAGTSSSDPALATDRDVSTVLQQPLPSSLDPHTADDTLHVHNGGTGYQEEISMQSLVILDGHGRIRPVRWLQNEDECTSAFSTEKQTGEEFLR
ncbi:hypothetical protein JCGZ_09180 [Jatropha curcas]|uniref:Uncharacterized protein n=1 Tax=Jatropha curcas TaxID=180498 RepID=A0A067KFI9_JATCU|nr:hypothetical protein JCGZ_09180 [Jatropha curcas]